MEQNNPDQSQEMYDCEKLKTQYPDPQRSQKEMDKALDDLMLSSSRDEQSGNLLACLVCFGANPNKVAREYKSTGLVIRHFFGHKVTGSFGIHYTCPLQYAVETDDAQLVSFLLKHKAHANISWIMRFARLQDHMNNYILPISNLLTYGNNTRYYDRPCKIKPYDETPLFSKIRSVAIARALAPYVNINKEILRGGVISRNLAHYTIDPDLFEYFVDNSDIANVVDNETQEIPLHRLADGCAIYLYSPDPNILLRNASSLVKKTRNINALNYRGKTPLDKAEVASDFIPPCQELVKLFKEHGGEHGAQETRRPDYVSQKVNKIIHEQVMQKE